MKLSQWLRTLAAVSAAVLLSIGVSRSVSAAAGVIILGDSRAEDMHTFVGDAGVSWCYKVGMGYLWMMSEGIPTIDGDVGNGTAVVITLGVNDVVDQFRIPQYAEAINAKAAEWKARGAQTFYVSITPVDDALDHYEHNSDIEYWNTTIQGLLSPDVYYLDLYHVLLGNFSTVDGLHYDAATYRNIFDLIISGVESAGYYPYLDDYTDDGLPRTIMTVADTETSLSDAEAPASEAGAGGNPGETGAAEAGNPGEAGAAEAGNPGEAVAAEAGAEGSPGEALAPGAGSGTSPEAAAAEPVPEAPDTQEAPAVSGAETIPAEGDAQAPANGWQEDGQGRRSYFVDGEPATGLQEIDGQQYYFGTDGVLATGWVENGDNIYCADSSGIIHTGWITDGWHWYYADESGILVRGWFRRDGKRFYADNTGVIQSGWLKDRDNTYYLDTDGHALSGWYKIGGSTYYFDEIGIMATGEQTLYGQSYLFNEDGELVESPEGAAPDAIEIGKGS